MLKIFLFLIVNTSLFAQVKGVVVDGNNKPIPYVSIWVENEENGTTSEENGNFVLKLLDREKTLVFSALGFETKKVKAIQAEKVVLKELAYQLEEVAISNSLKKKQIYVGDYNSGGIRHHYSSSFNNPVILAKHFLYSKEIEDHSFIKSIEFYTKSKINDAKVNIQLLEIDEFGNPGNSINQENIIVRVKKGNKNTIVNIEKQKISVPKNGIFIMIETLIIPENLFKEEREYKAGAKKNRFLIESYEPIFGFLPSENCSTWKKSGTNWKQMNEKVIIKNHEDFTQILMRKYHDKYYDFPIKLTLTN